jgi:putative ABC transport system permease protein
MMFWRRRKQNDFNAEVEAHIALEADRLKEQGSGEEEAHMAARRAFGNVTQARERFYESSRWRWWDELRQDVRYGLRQLRRNPGFTVVAVLTLALGIGANTAAFSVVYGILFRPLPYAHPDRLTLIMQGDPKTGPQSQSTISAPEFLYMRDHDQGLDGLTAFTLGAFHLGNVSEPRPVYAIVCTANYFAVLGVRPMLGREFLRSEEETGANHVVILSHALWQQVYGSDPKAIGRTLRLGDAIYTIVGVMPAAFEAPWYEHTDVWIPLAVDAPKNAGPGIPGVMVFGRLKPGQKIEQGRAYLQTLANAWRANNPGKSHDWTVKIYTLWDFIVGGNQTSLLTLFGLASFVLLIACANLANLFLARATLRQREIAVRITLGASRPRVIRQVLTESVLLAVAGGAVAILLAIWAVDLSRVSLAASYLRRMHDVVVDGRILSFALGVSILTGLVVGLFPALRGLGMKGRPTIGESLKEGGRAHVAGLRGSWVRNLLVVSEIALSVILTVGAGLMARTFLNLRPVDTGFDPESKLTLAFQLPQRQNPNALQRTNFLRDVIARIEAVSAVKSVAATSTLPMSGFGYFATVTAAGSPSKSEKPERAYEECITDNYLRVMGIPLVAGRQSSEMDSESAPGVAVVNQTAARALWPGENPLGKQILVHDPDSQKLWRVVGVAGDVRQFGSDTRPRPQIYLPYRQNPTPSVCLVVQSTGDPSKLIPVVRGQIASVDKDLDLYQVETMEDMLSESVAVPHFFAVFIGALALLGLLLAAVGVYGVLSYATAQRTHEIGIRMALGAERTDVLRLVIGQGLKLAWIGVVIGLAGALALTQFLTSLLYGVKPTDPLTFIAVSLILIAVALLACYIPARRAAKVHPMVALRYE